MILTVVSVSGSKTAINDQIRDTPGIEAIDTAAPDANPVDVAPTVAALLGGCEQFAGIGGPEISDRPPVKGGGRPTTRAFRAFRRLNVMPVRFNRAQVAHLQRSN